MGVWVGDFVSVVDNEVVGIPFIVGKAVDSDPEIAVTLIVLIFHHVFAEELVVVPRRHEHNAGLAGSGEAECHCAVGIFDSTHTGCTAGISFGL